MPKIELNITHANETTMCFESKILWISIDIVQVFIPVDTINFYIVNISAPFLLCLKDINTFSIHLNNITNQLICQDGKSILIFHKLIYIWFFVNKNNKIAASIYLTEEELFSVHICFEYLLANKLYKLLI